MIQAVLRQVVQAGQIFASTPERARCHPCKSRLEARLPLTMTRALEILARHVRDVGRALMPAGCSVERRNAFPRYAPVQTELTAPTDGAHSPVGSVDQCNTARSLSAGGLKPKGFPGR